MDFVDLINDQNAKISDTSPYLDLIWAHLTNKTETNLETPTIERRVFLEHLPVNLQLFLNDCIQKIQEDNATINFADVKIKYLKSFLYWCLLCGEQEGHIVPLTAARLYFMLNTLLQSTEHNVFMENMYNAALNTIEIAIACENIPTQTQLVVDALRLFLKKHKIKKETTANTVTILNKIITLDNSKTLKEFNTGI